MVHSEENMRASLKDLRRVVIKLGTKILVDQNGQLIEPRIESLVLQCVELLKAGKQVVIVSSGAVGAGLKVLKRETRPDNLADKQLAAAVGQAQLVALYERLFSKAGFHVGQVLMTHENLNVPTQKDNIQKTMNNLLVHSVVPIVNENDVVSVEELKFGDNDKLAAMVAELVDAEMLVLLTTANGLEDEDSKVISYVSDISEKEFSYVNDADNGLSLGGMKSKLESAKLAAKTCKYVVIASGVKEGIISSIFAGEKVGTLIGG